MAVGTTNTTIVLTTIAPVTIGDIPAILSITMMVFPMRSDGASSHGDWAILFIAVATAYIVILTLRPRFTIQVG